MPTGKKPSKQDIERGGFNPIPANPGREKEQLGPAPEVPPSQVTERMPKHQPSQPRPSPTHDALDADGVSAQAVSRSDLKSAVRAAQIESDVAGEIESRAEPGSSVDMARHWADYRNFLHIGRMFVGVAAVTLAILGYTFA